MNMQSNNEGALAFLELKCCEAIPDNLGDTVMGWARNPGSDVDWTKGYMDALIEYMQQNNINEI